MNSQKKSNDFFSKFVNWFSDSGRDKPPINREQGSQDFFSRLMNQISD